jgi:hypothetical protein
LQANAPSNAPSHSKTHHCTYPKAHSRDHPRTHSITDATIHPKALYYPGTNLRADIKAESFPVSSPNVRADFKADTSPVSAPNVRADFGANSSPVSSPNVRANSRAHFMRQIILGVGVWHVAKVVISLLVAGVLEGRCIDVLSDGGTVFMRNWLGGGFSLRSGDGSDLGRCSCFGNGGGGISSSPSSAGRG